MAGPAWWIERPSIEIQASVESTTLGSFVFELTGAPEKVDAFIELMRDLGLAEVSRSGIAALSRGTRVI